MALTMPGVRPSPQSPTAPRLDLDDSVEQDEDEWHVVRDGEYARPLPYVVCRDGTPVFVGPLGSGIVTGTLNAGTRVICAQPADDGGAAVRCVEPVEGWISFLSPEGALQLSACSSSDGHDRLSDPSSSPNGSNNSYDNGNQVSRGPGEVWRYRVVTRRGGALVRRGLELESKEGRNIPNGEIVEVSERRINKDGIPRLRVDGGWISEILNPASGQRGVIAEIVPLERPLLYRVVYPNGAVVRAAVELGSAVVKTLECGVVVQVAEKQFSDQPRHHCVQRLRLADCSGWISLRLNQEPPKDEIVAVCLGLAEDKPSPQASSSSPAFRWGRSPSAAAAAAAEGPPLPPPPVRPNAAGPREERLAATWLEQAKVKRAPLHDDDSCVVCCEGLRTATLVHGETGHIACCLDCARVLHARGDTCPVCRVPIDRVVQHFWA